MPAKQENIRGKRPVTVALALQAALKRRIKIHSIIELQHSPKAHKINDKAKETHFHRFFPNPVAKDT
jgi:hypothetical protein